jgi:hypothetical protein
LIYLELIYNQIMLKKITQILRSGEKDEF